jgi:hypothetical protein
MPAQVPSRYAVASPHQLDIDVPHLLVQGIGSDDPDLIDLNRGPRASYVEISGAGHFDIAYPCSNAWEKVVAEIVKRVSSREHGRVERTSQMDAKGN